MSWQEILKKDKIVKDALEKYADNLLDKKFQSKGDTVRDMELFKDFKNGDTFKLGELTFRIDALSNTDEGVYGIENTGIKKGKILFNDVVIGIFMVSTEDAGSGRGKIELGSQFNVDWDSGGKVDTAIAELYNKIKRG